MEFLDKAGLQTLWSKLIPVNKKKVQLSLKYDQSVIEAIKEYINNNINCNINNFASSVLNYIIFTVKYNNNTITVGHILLHVEANTNTSNESAAGGIGFIMDGYTECDIDLHSPGFYSSSLYNIIIDTSIISDNIDIKLFASEN